MKRFKMGIAWIKYKDRIVNEVNNGKRGSGYSAIRKLGDIPCDLDKKQEFSKPLYCLAVLEGRQSKTKPILSQHDVHRKLKSVKRPNSAVNGDVPKKAIQQIFFPMGWSSGKHFKKTIQSSEWQAARWKVEWKCTGDPRLIKDEDDVRTISNSCPKCWKMY